jgi:hypothetical protein
MFLTYDSLPHTGSYHIHKRAVAFNPFFQFTVIYCLIHKISEFIVYNYSSISLSQFY